MSRNVEREQALEATRKGLTFDVVKFLSTGIAPDWISPEAFNDEPLLHQAILNRYGETGLAIVACGADLEQRDRGRKTGFSHAANIGYLEGCLMLLAAGAADDPRDSEGFKPEHLARERGFEALADFIRQISYARHIYRNQPRQPTFRSVILRNDEPEINTPLGYAEPGRLSAVLAARKDVLSRLDQSLTDIRLRPIIHSIIMSGKAEFKRYYPGAAGTGGMDPMGYADHEGGGPAINQIRISKRGWKEASPRVEETLNRLEIAFDPMTSGLSCELGLFKLERVAVDFTGREYREFDMTHTGGVMTCSRRFKDERGFDKAIFSNPNFIQREELVDTEGWKRCTRCKAPLRPKEMRHEAQTASLTGDEVLLFQSMLKGGWDGALDLCLKGTRLDAVTFNGNQLTHVGSWCKDGIGWCPHSEALATVMACGADPKATNDARENSLHVSAFFGRYFPSLIHLARGVDPWAKDAFGNTPIDLARMNGREKLAELIETIASARDLYERCKDLAEESGAYEGEHNKLKA